MNLENCLKYDSYFKKSWLKTIEEEFSKHETVTRFQIEQILSKGFDIGYSEGYGDAY